MAISRLKALLNELEQDRSLYEPNQLRRRVEALDHLEACLIHMPGQGDDETSALHRVEVITGELEASNRKLYQSIREEIRRGTGAQALSRWMAASSASESVDQAVSSEGYDYLDALVSGVLQFEEPTEDITPLAPDMVFYQPTPARHIFDLIRRTSWDERDVLMDLGSGLGHVSLLTAICTRIRCIGIELESAYVTSATHCAQSLNLRNVSFIQQDVRLADFSNGTVFYLYTPFTGTMLRDVLNRLKREASYREIRVCALGPCTSILGQEKWLKTVDNHGVDRIAIFRSI